MCFKDNMESFLMNWQISPQIFYSDDRANCCSVIITMWHFPRENQTLTILWAWKRSVCPQEQLFLLSDFTVWEFQEMGFACITSAKSFVWYYVFKMSPTTLNKCCTRNIVLTLWTKRLYDFTKKNNNNTVCGVEFVEG